MLEPAGYVLMVYLMADLDVYVDSVKRFRRFSDYTLHIMLAGLNRVGLTHRLIDKFAPGSLAESAFLHVDLTELPEEFAAVKDSYRNCVNGRAVSINRKLYSMASLEREDDFHGPVITKTVLNHQGVPEYCYNRDRSILARLRHKFNKRQDPRFLDKICPPYKIYESIGQVPSAIWSDPCFIVETFLPGTLELPIVKHRYEFFLECGLNTRSVFDSLHCDPLTAISVDDAGDVPEAIQDVRRRLGLDFGSIDYFVVGDEAIVIDANKTVTATLEWFAEYPFLVRYFDDVTDRLAAFVRGH
jgi:hypothetical protein